MSKLNSIRAQSTWRDIIEGQPQQVAIFALMALGAGSLLETSADAPTVLGLTSYNWAVVSIVLAGVHQLIVAIVFRLQLHRNLLTDLFGQRDMAIWAAVFMPLLVARPITLILTGWSDVVGITSWRAPELILGLALIGVAVWSMRSSGCTCTVPKGRICAGFTVIRPFAQGSSPQLSPQS